MPKPVVFACPSCGASLSVEEGASTTRCQFCYNTVIVPEEMRTAKPVVTPNVVGGMGASSPGMANLMGQSQQLKEMGNQIRAGNTLEAIKLYRQLFGSGLAEAKDAVERLAMGQSVQVMHLGTPTTIQVDRGPSASIGGPTFIPTVQSVRQPMMQPMQPVIITGNPGRGFGCIIAAVLLTTGLGILITLLATGGAMLPFLATFFGGDGLGVPDSVSSLLTGEAPSTATRPAPAATATMEPTPGFASPVLSFGGEGTGGGTFNDPRHIGVDGDGNIYVGEWEEHRVQVFDAEGDFVTQWSAGKDDGVLTSMAVAPDGTVYTVAGTQLYYYEGATGDLLGQIEYEGTHGFRDVTVTADGGLLVAWSAAGIENIVRFDRDGAIDLRLPEAISSITGDKGTDFNMRLVADGSGTIYALGNFHQAVFRFAPDGTFQNQFGGKGDEPGLFRSPNAIAVDKQGRIYVTDRKGIQVFDDSGRYLNVFDVPDRGTVYGITFDGDNFLYAVGNNDLVYKFEINE